MSFTDEDLKRLKDGLLGNPSAVQDFEAGWLASLLSRLEAAEKAVEASEDCDAGIVDACEMRALWKAWRKAAGK